MTSAVLLIVALGGLLSIASSCIRWAARKQLRHRRKHNIRIFDPSVQAPSGGDSGPQAAFPAGNYLSAVKCSETPGGHGSSCSKFYGQRRLESPCE